MKSALVFGLLVSSAVAFAQTSTTTVQSSSEKSVLSKIANPASAKPVAKRSRSSASALNTSSTTFTQKSHSSGFWAAEHFSAGLSFIGASELRGIKLKAGDARGSATGTTSNGLALMGQYRGSFSPEWAMTGSLAIHQSKNIAKLNGSIEDDHFANSFGSKPSFQPWVLAINGEYHLNDYVYFPAGLNTTIYNSIHAGPFDQMSMDPRPGFQLGVGGNLQKMVDVELTFQSLRYMFHAQNNNGIHADGDVTYDGVNLTGRYVF